MKIDGQQAGKIQSFASIALHTALQTGQVTLTVRGKPVKTAGLTPLRKLFKQELYRTSSLPKRLSDDDFLSDQHMLEFNIDGGALGKEAQLGIDNERFAHLDEGAQEAALSLKVYLDEARVFTMPVVCNPKIALQLNNVMIGMFEAFTATKACWKDEASAFNALAASAAAAVDRLLPSSMDKTVELLDLVEQHGKEKDCVLGPNTKAQTET